MEPSILKIPDLKSPTAVSSPGNNPFDDMWKKTLDAISISDQVDRRSSIRVSRGVVNTDRHSLSFCDLNASDFGRESLGILPPDFIRDRMNFINTSNLEMDRESLGLLHINSRESLSFRRESLGILNLQDLGRESLDCGKESLGILHLKSPDCKFGEEKRIPDIVLTTIQENDDTVSNILDTAFLQSHSRKLSSLSSSSSMIRSFNTISLEGPSRIYSVSSTKSIKDVRTDSLDDYITFSNSSAVSSIHSPLNRGKILSPSEVRSRVFSLPENSNHKLDNTSEIKIWSANGISDTHLKTFERSFHRHLDFKESDISNEFQDSVFIEGNLLAEKIADGSILNDSNGEAIGVLDNTPQPDWPNDLSCNDAKASDLPKCDTETVFKTIDKMLPVPIQESLNMKLKTKSGSSSSNESNRRSNVSEEEQQSAGEHNVSKLLHNISNIQESKNVSMSKKDPKEVLQNLSELLNTTSHSDRQKSEGQLLLNSLANILYDNKSNSRNNDDSGHSSEHSDSLNRESQECFEELDLGTKSRSQVSNESSKENIIPSNLSLKSKPIEKLLEKRLSRSLCSSNITNKCMVLPEKRTASASSLDKHITSNSSVASNNSKNSSNLVKSQISGSMSKSSNSSKKGPMKAVIPVGDMKKKSSTCSTPNKNQQKIPTIAPKRTSTPINEPKLKPMAASTPTSRSLSKMKKPISSFSKNVTPDKPSTTLSKPSSINVECKPRRNSVSCIQHSNGNNGAIQRRNSVEKDSGVESAVKRIRQNIGRISQRNSIHSRNSSNMDPTLKPFLKTTPIKQNKTTAESALNQSPKQLINRPSTHQRSTSSLELRNKSHSNRSSVGEISNKNNIEVNKPRSSVSIGSGIVTSFAQIRQNMLDSPYFNLMEKNMNTSSQQSVMKQLPQGKKIGKENKEKYVRGNK